MDWLILALATIDLLVCLYVGWQLIVGGRQLRKLGDVEPLASGLLPTLSVVVAARNESRNIEAGLRSLLQVDYERLEIIAVNDRSTDETGAILDRVAATDARLKVVHIDQLPPGWLGKNHALDCGAAQATGEFLLFTDADVVLAPSVLRRAMTYAVREQIDHLAAFFQVRMPTWFLESFVVLFSLYFFAYFKPWKVRDPSSSAHVGVGGFNLIRAAAYRAMGTHRAIAMRPDDDVKLGKLVKKHGFRSDVVVAVDLISVPWYASLRELVHGLEKNAFAGIDYNVPLLVASSLYALTMHFGPFVAIFLTTGLTRWVLVAVVLLLLAMAMGAARQNQLRPWTALALPLAVLVFVFIQWRTMIINLWQGGIRWRDTFYPLADLKANRI